MRLPCHFCVALFCSLLNSACGDTPSTCEGAACAGSGGVSSTGSAGGTSTGGSTGGTTATHVGGEGTGGAAAGGSSTGGPGTASVAAGGTAGAGMEAGSGGAAGGETGAGTVSEDGGAGGSGGKVSGQPIWDANENVMFEMWYCPHFGTDDVAYSWGASAAELTPRERELVASLVLTAPNNPYVCDMSWIEIYVTDQAGTRSNYPAVRPRCATVPYVSFDTVASLAPCPDVHGSLAPTPEEAPAIQAGRCRWLGASSAQDTARASKAPDLWARFSATAGEQYVATVVADTGVSQIMGLALYDTSGSTLLSQAGAGQRLLFTGPGEYAIRLTNSTDTSEYVALDLRSIPAAPDG